VYFLTFPANPLNKKSHKITKNRESVFSCFRNLPILAKEREEEVDPLHKTIRNVVIRKNKDGMAKKTI
jgi:hypothetical protein